MPAFVTHHIFADRVFSALPPDAAALAGRHSIAYFWGAQGPDPLAYHNFPLGGQLTSVCAAMHEGDPAPLFETIISAASKQEAYIAWVLGFAAHYVIDCALEPFLRYTACNKLAPLYKESEGTAYLRAAAAVDRAMIAEYLSGEPNDYPAHRLLKPLTGDLRRQIPAMLAAAAAHTARRSIRPADCRSALHTMELTASTLRADTDSAKDKLRAIELRAGCPDILTARLRPLIQPSGDLCNRRHTDWFDGSGTPRDEDAFSLLEQAIPTAVKLSGSVFSSCISGEKVQIMLLDDNFYGVPVDRG